MRMNFLFKTLFLPVLLVLIVSSCRKEVKSKSTEANSLSTSEASSVKLESDLLKAVRNATSRFHSTNQAIKAGYLPTDECVSVPGLGGMGYHWVNPTIVNPEFDPLKPEAVLYASGPGGKLRLVALEYIVIDVGQPRPSFGDQLFDIGGTPIPDPHYSLHVWLYEKNPTGMFMPFNPNVTCP